MKIKKVAQTPGVVATVSNSKIDSDKDTYSCNYLNYNRENYSTEEQRIGTWIDGKPIYKRTFVVSRDADSSEFYQNFITGLYPDCLVNAYGFFKTTAGDMRIIGGSEAPNGTNETTRILVNGTNGNVAIQGHAFSEARTFYITIEYTKTTD